MITEDEIKEIFGNEAELLISLYDGSDFNNYEDFFIYSIQNYFNFLELDKDIDENKKELLENIFNVS